MSKRSLFVLQQRSQSPLRPCVNSALCSAPPAVVGAATGACPPRASCRGPSCVSHMVDWLAASGRKVLDASPLSYGCCLGGWVGATTATTQIPQRRRHCREFADPSCRFQRDRSSRRFRLSLCRCGVVHSNGSPKSRPAYPSYRRDAGATKVFGKEPAGRKKLQRRHFFFFAYCIFVCFSVAGFFFYWLFSLGVADRKEKNWQITVCCESAMPRAHKGTKFQFSASAPVILASHGRNADCPMDKSKKKTIG